ncbi:MAG: DUF11 domain-containing protein, partial [Saprospiraceae bacterium]|nr:DUF11 domain-containing protein [Saprospiraceae bacterium]
MKLTKLVSTLLFVTVLCIIDSFAQTPISIGDHVWVDANRNGIQDASESPLANINVMLFRTSTNTMVSSATTDASGNYLFSSSTSTSTASSKYNLALLYDEPYEIRVDLSQFALTSNNYEVTTLDAFNGINSDDTDNDASQVGGMAIVSLTTPSVGSVDNSYDIGFAPADYILTKSSNKSTAQVGDQVIFTVTLVNPNTISLNNIQINDVLPSCLSYVSSSGTGGSYSAATGVWSVGSLAGGGTATMNITTTVTGMGICENLASLATDTVAACVSTPLIFCPVQSPNGYRLEIDPTYVNIKWFKDGVEIIGATSNVYNATQEGVYTTTAELYAGCPVQSCCPFILDAQCFDLALIKVISPTQTLPIYTGDDVTFKITVTNQGDLTGTNIVLSDYIPTGLTLNDSDWTASGSTATLNTPIASLASGASTSVDITFTVNSTFTGSTIVNYAEISAANNIVNFPDIDSSPDAINNNDAGGAVGSAADDDITGDGTGTVGGSVAATDEDDHDPAQISIQRMDLALRKTTAQVNPVYPGDDVVFTVTVFNQGNVAATDIVVTDYIPTNFILSPVGNAIWNSVSATTANTTIAGPLAPGDSAKVDITLRVIPNPASGSFNNFAEITSMKDVAGVDRSNYDFDSTPDAIQANDSVVDDVIDNAGGDEDDQDLAAVVIAEMDLALAKTTSVVNPVIAGDIVPFTITVTNQGTVPAKNIVVTDYIPSGFVFAPSTGWTSAGTTATTTIAGPLLPGQSTQTIINLTVLKTATRGAHVNYAEITSMQDTFGIDRSAYDVDSTPDANNTNDAGGQPG